jgi:hypothetical protein
MELGSLRANVSANRHGHAGDEPFRNLHILNSCFDLSLTAVVVAMFAPSVDCNNSPASQNKQRQIDTFNVSEPS